MNKKLQRHRKLIKEPDYKYKVNQIVRNKIWRHADITSVLYGEYIIIKRTKKHYSCKIWDYLLNEKQEITKIWHYDKLQKYTIKEFNSKHLELSPNTLEDIKTYELLYKGVNYEKLGV